MQLFGYGLKRYGKMTMPCQGITEGGVSPWDFEGFGCVKKMERSDSIILVILGNLAHFRHSFFRVKPWTLNPQRKNRYIDKGHS